MAACPSAMEFISSRSPAIEWSQRRFIAANDAPAEPHAAKQAVLADQGVVEGTGHMQGDQRPEQAAEMVADSRRAALAMFPDKALAYDLIYKPRLQRIMRERFRIQ